MSRADRALDQADRTPGVGPGSRLSGAIHLSESRERVRRPRGQLRQPAQACDQVIQALRDVLAGRLLIEPHRFLGDGDPFQAGTLQRPGAVQNVGNGVGHRLVGFLGPLAADTGS